MEIEYGKYLIKHSEGSEHFDLYKKVTPKKVDGTLGGERERVLGYDMRMPKVMEHIINQEMKEDRSVVTLEDFIGRFVVETSTLVGAFKDFKRNG